jgi:hypothetical protein
MALERCIEDVSAFMTACGQEIGVGLIHPQTDLYLNLINEEFGEFVEGIKTKNMLEVLDGALDTIWVVSGYLISRFGDERRIIVTTHLSSSIESVVASAQGFLNAINPKSVMVPEDVVYSAATVFCNELAQFCICLGMSVHQGWAEVRRSNMSKLDPETGVAIKREDGKILKPASYSPPNLKPFASQEMATSTLLPQ